MFNDPCTTFFLQKKEEAKKVNFKMLIRSRRPRRNRYLQIGLFFIIYTCYHAYSAAVVKRDVGSDSMESFSLSPEVEVETEEDVATRGSDMEELPEVSSTKATGLNIHGYPTLRPVRHFKV
jgi:hypothetical protein